MDWEERAGADRELEVGWEGSETVSLHRATEPRPGHHWSVGHQGEPEEVITSREVHRAAQTWSFKGKRKDTWRETG